MKQRYEGQIKYDSSSNKLTFRGNDLNISCESIQDLHSHVYDMSDIIQDIYKQCDKIVIESRDEIIDNIIKQLEP